MDRIRKNLTSRQTILFVALLARFLCLFFFFHVHVGRYLVRQETGSIAASIAAGQGFSSPFYLPSGPTAWVTPVFPYILGAVFKVFGTLTLHSSIAIRSLNVLFSALTCYPIILLGTKLFGDAVGAFRLDLGFPSHGDFASCYEGLGHEPRGPNAYRRSLVDLCGRRPPGCCGLDLIRFRVGLHGARQRRRTFRFPRMSIVRTLPAQAARNRMAAPRRLAVLAFALTVSPWIIRTQIVFHGKGLFRSNLELELWLGNNPEVPWWLHPLDSPTEHREFTRVGEVAYTEEKKRPPFNS